jgi:hypothetical protein
VASNIRITLCTLAQGCTLNDPTKSKIFKNQTQIHAVFKWRMISHIHDEQWKSSMRESKWVY